MFFKNRRKAEDALRARLDALITTLEKGGSSQPAPSPDRQADAVLARIRELEETVKDLDTDLDWLTAEVKRMRGKLTGGERRTQRNGSSEEASPATATPPRYSPQWFADQRRRLNLPSPPA